MKKKLLLIDGFSIINRAYYAMPPMTTKNGELTNAVYGFLNIFFRFYNEENPDYIAVCFDAKGPTFRHEMYALYKGTRKGMPQELLVQVPVVRTLLEKMGIKTLELEGYEADDVLGTASKKAEGEGHLVTVISGDRDLLQIASKYITVRIPKTKGGKTEVESYDENTINHIFGITPTQIIDVKALMGDSSDNIPGVPSIGEKTAYKLIQEFGSVEAAIENAWNITPKKASENLEKHSDLAMLSKKLAAIDLNVPIDINFEEMTADEIYNEKAGEEIRRLEFKSFYSLFKTYKSEKAGIDILTIGLDELSDILNKIGNENTAYHLLLNDGELLGISLCYNERSSYFLPTKDSEENFISHFKTFFESEIPKVSTEIKTDLHYLNKFNINPKNLVFDVSLAAYVLDSSKDYSEFSEIAKDFLLENYSSKEEFFGKGKSKKGPLELNETEISRYAGNIVEAAFRLYTLMNNGLNANDQKSLYYDMELPLVFVLEDMEKQGIKVDKNALIEYGRKLSLSIDSLTKNIYSLAGGEFNLNSPKQLGAVLFDKLGLKGGKKTKTGWSTAADVLEKLAEDNEIVALILEYRTFSKLKSTYADGLLSVIDEKTGKIYTTFNQTATSTGRISSTEPNLQNIPIRTELGRELRKVFIAEENCVFIDADYSQIELRILAHMSGDETFINAFLHNDDIHRITASQVFNTPLSEVTQTQRSNAKAVNFGIVYGISAFALSQDLGISVKEAQNYIDGYFGRYEKVKEYLDGAVSFAKEKGYALTAFNRRRIIPELKADNFAIRSFGERAAMNAPIQGTAADIIKVAMVRVYNRFKAEGMKSKIILQVHDELLINAPEEEVQKAAEILKLEMETAVSFKAPMSVDISIGKSWFDAK